MKNDKQMNTALLVFGIILVGVGTFFLTINILSVLSVEKLWPLFLLIPVTILVAVWLQKRSQAGGVILPVVILVYFCVYFLWLNFTSWNNVEWTWPHFLAAPGIGFLFLSFFINRWQYLIPSVLLLVLAGIFFAALLGNTLLISIIFIAAGVLMIVKPLLVKKETADNN